MVAGKREDLARAIRIHVRSSWKRHSEATHRGLQRMASGSGGEFSDYHQGNNHASYRIFAVGQPRNTYRDIPTKLV